MKNKNIFFKSTLILIFGGIITKILGFIIRIMYTRIVGEEVLGLYSLVMPTYSLLVTIATLALPTTISKLVAEGKHNNLKIISNSTILILSINIIVIVLMFLLSPFISNVLLHEKRVHLLLISMSLTFPIISISSIVKGYFYGKQNMLPNVISNIFEQIVKGLLIYFLVPIIMVKSEVLAACSLFFFSFIEELVSIFINISFLPKKIKITKTNLKYDKNTIKSILDISIPTVSSRVVGNIGYFFEPIVLQNLLLFTGFSPTYILREYGAFNAYTIATLTVPSFFITAISSSLIPEVSKYYLKNNYFMLKKRLKEAIKFALLIGIPYSVMLILFGKIILYILYHTHLGLNYIRILAPIFPLFYIENILISFMQGINKAKITMKITIIGVIIKNVILAIALLLHLGMYALVISEIVNIFVVVFLNLYYTYKFFKL